MRAILSYNVNVINIVDLMDCISATEWMVRVFVRGTPPPPPVDSMEGEAIKPSPKISPLSVLPPADLRLNEEVKEVGEAAST